MCHEKCGRLKSCLVSLIQPVMLIREEELFGVRDINDLVMFLKSNRRFDKANAIVFMR